MSKLLFNAKRQVFCCMMAALLLAGCGDGGTTFTLKIDANPSVGGTVSPTGNIKYPVGTEATITATAADGYLFAGWSGASTAKTKSVTVTMNSKQTLTANFEKFTPTFTDSRDGKSYRRVKIGNLIWMAENLNYETAGSLCYGKDDSNCEKYGRLYTWDAATKACPDGWRLPDTTDFNDFGEAIGDDENIAGGKLKSKTGWNNNGNGTDDVGFSALPGGSFIAGIRISRHQFLGGDIVERENFNDIGNSGTWWVSMSAPWQYNGSIFKGAARLRLSYANQSIDVDIRNAANANSVRCVRD